MARLVMSTIGGGRVGDGDPSSLGMPAKLSACCAERIDASPWPSLATRRGFAIGQTAVSVFPITGMWQISEPSTAVGDVVHQILHFCKGRHIHFKLRREVVIDSAGGDAHCCGY